MPTYTTNYGLSKPLVNNATDQDLWGGELNDDMDDIDGLTYTAINYAVSSKTANYSVVAPTSGSTTTGDSKKLFLCDASGGAFALSLPAAASAANMEIAVKRINSGANNVTITPNGGNTIDGQSSLVLTEQYQWAVLVCNGTDWLIISRKQTATTFTAPTVQRFTSGSGTYTTPASVLYLHVRMAAGGGGGGGSSGGTGGNGGDSSFGTWTAIHGNGGVSSTNGAGGAGGTGGVDGTGSLLVRAGGQSGGAAFVTAGQTNPGMGGSSYLGGGGAIAGYQNTNGGSAKANTGSGGAGSTSAGVVNTGTGGGAGEYVEFIVTSPGASYSYVVGTGGAGGAGGTTTGGNGAAGILIVEEYYQ